MPLTNQASLVCKCTTGADSPDVGSQQLSCRVLAFLCSNTLKHCCFFVCPHTLPSTSGTNSLVLQQTDFTVDYSAVRFFVMHLIARNILEQLLTKTALHRLASRSFLIERQKFQDTANQRGNRGQRKLYGDEL